MEECKRRALAYMRKQHEKDFAKASFVAGAIWPGVMFHAQGGGAAASRVLKALEKDGLARWSSNFRNWGWILTDKGKAQK